jgi:hypothetical protein
MLSVLEIQIAVINPVEVCLQKTQDLGQENGRVVELSYAVFVE